MKILLLAISLNLNGVAKATNCNLSASIANNHQTRTVILNTVSSRKAISFIGVIYAIPNTDNCFFSDLNKPVCNTVSLNSCVADPNPIFKIHLSLLPEILA